MRYAAAALIVWLVTACGTPNNCPVIVDIADADASVFQGCAELAETDEERMRGLQGHAPLVGNEALVLLAPVAGQTCIHNEGVDFAIEAVFVEADGNVVAVEHSIPAGDAQLRCYQGVQLVVELAQGAGEDIAPGQYVTLLR